MKIMCCGDSWTAGYGVDSSVVWTNSLPGKIINRGKNGTSNFRIVDSLKRSIITYNPDVVIIGWSGVTRYHHNGRSFDWCWAQDYELRDNFFANKSLSDLENDFVNLNTEVDELCKSKNIKLIKFSVFGDFKYLWDEKFTKHSFLELLSEKQGITFQNNVPFFEFDFLSDRNFTNTNNFAKKYFSGNWKMAIVERENIRPGEMFLNCGHPSPAGHHIWADYIREYL